MFAAHPCFGYFSGMFHLADIWNIAGCPKLFPESWQEVTSEATNLKASLAGLKYKSDRAQTAQAFREAKKLPSCRKRWKRWTGGLTGFEVDIYIYIYIYMHSCSSMVSCSCSFEMTQHRVHTYATTLIGIERSPKPGSKSHISKLFAFNLRLFLKTEKGKPQARSLSVF